MDQIHLRFTPTSNINPDYMFMMWQKYDQSVTGSTDHELLNDVTCANAYVYHSEACQREYEEISKLFKMYVDNIIAHRHNSAMIMYRLDIEKIIVRMSGYMITVSGSNSNYKKLLSVVSCMTDLLPTDTSGVIFMENVPMNDLRKLII